MKSREIRQNGKVELETLKAFAHDRLPTSSPLRDLILTEPDKLPASEFLVKSKVWLKLLERHEGGANS